MPSRVLIHFPEPDSPELVDRRPACRPERGEEFPRGWTVADYNLVRGDFEGEPYAYEVWVIPLPDPDLTLPGEARGSAGRIPPSSPPGEPA